MARIRTIKPEFWDSPSTKNAGPWARLLYIAMWNWADDYGRGTANLKELEGFAFPNDDTFTDRSGNTVHFRDLVAEVSECFGVVFYEADGRPLYAIPAWEKHQRNERRAKCSRYPEPPSQTESSGNTVNLRWPGSEVPHTSDPGTGEQRNRGTEAAQRGPSDDNFNAFWSAFPRRIAKEAARKAWAKAVKTTDPSVLIEAAATYATTTKGTDPKFIKHPATWLNGGCWEDETFTPPPSVPIEEDWGA